MRVAVGVLLSAVLLVLRGCCRPCGRDFSMSVRDSVGSDVRREVLWVRDTVEVRLPAERTSAVVRDSISRLETRYAVSEAGVRGDGTLWHWLEQKGTVVPVEVAHREERRDSVVWRNRAVERVRVREVERQWSVWERLQWWVGRGALGVVLGWVLWRWGWPLLKVLLKRIL